MTISPPANVISSPETDFRVLSSNIDTLYLSMNISWHDETFFRILDNEKNKAAKVKQNSFINFILPDGNLSFEIKPFGVNGYSWLIYNRNYSLKIGNWLQPLSRPSIMIEIHSETLWSFGPLEAVKYIVNFIRFFGGEMKSIKPSRVDLCLDLLVPENFWNIDLIKYKVTRATDTRTHFKHNKLTGISIGKGKISARLYDKVLEIKQQSKKFWMFDIWGFQEVPEGKRVIRIEFQLRRELLKELNIDLIYTMFRYIDNIWGYCAQQWLKFQDYPSKHHNSRKTFPWWQVVQNGFMGIQAPEPLIRYKSINTNEKYIYNQTLGALTSNAALVAENNITDTRMAYFMADPSCLADFFKINPYEILKRVDQKRARYQQAKIKDLEIHRKRQEKGFPTTLPQHIKKDRHESE